MTSLRSRMRYMNPYDIHKAIINEYVLKQPGDTKLLQRDASKDRTDIDVLKANHRFLWDDSIPDTWEAQFAKKYYDKLFKEYCIADLTYYKENKIALRWRIEREVIEGKGQFTCGNKKCPERENLRTWEVNFAYKEQGEKKNALVKIRLCPDCSLKLNHKSKKREVKRLKSKKKKKVKKREKGDEEGGEEGGTSQPKSDSEPETSESPWDQHKPEEIKTRDEEMEDYLQDLLL
ncbi:protein FRA10AC1 homolog [Tribolium castaneum]|uniref:Protein FRA10AC1 homolog-like Protein n=1 Tax=Tribolium castaneum TaxID=7070 RepID=D7EIU5_TRICA|nr:PREDICTED: protein FRA10AC1 homolog [Tribolium castaneum]EFA12378.1 Protein FRA10AC1 homolog-like Protein [Tribolium castaneum]|eukprot:XP_967781.1 PREDICTED: protein FRA10AC1 homolog [Tribolium castaneum]